MEATNYSGLRVRAEGLGYASLQLPVAPVAPGASCTLFIEAVASDSEARTVRVIGFS